MYVPFANLSLFNPNCVGVGSIVPAATLSVSTSELGQYLGVSFSDISIQPFLSWLAPK